MIGEVTAREDRFILVVIVNSFISFARSLSPLIIV